MALESKGFGAGPKRTQFLALRFRLADAIVLVVLAAVATGAIWARLHGYGAVLDRL
jgi:energy-coupling factor transporter transmembrane protein EcfT